MKRRARPTSSCLTTLLIGGIFLVLLVVFLGRMVSLALYGRSAQGIITGRSACNAGSEGNVDIGWVLKIAYTDGAGRSHTFLTDCGHPQVATISSAVSVRYLPTDPSTADLADNLTFAPWLPALLLAFIGVLALAAILGGSEEIADFFALRKLHRLHKVKRL